MSAAQLLFALTFAATKHRDQRRKDVDASPYINHPIAVATVLAVEGRIDDVRLLMGAVLHDTVEDTQTKFEELTQLFGSGVAELVREVTDDKAERKRLQIEHAPGASAAAKQLKIADKICNIRDIAANPPQDWSVDRKLEYLVWAERVVAGCRGANSGLDTAFDEALGRARQLFASG